MKPVLSTSSSLATAVPPRFPVEMQLGRNYHQRCHPPLDSLLKVNMWSVFWFSSIGLDDIVITSMVRIDCEALPRSARGRCVVRSVLIGRQMIRRSVGSCLRSATKANDKIPGAAAIFRQTGNEEQVHWHKIIKNLAQWAFSADSLSVTCRSQWLWQMRIQLYHLLCVQTEDLQALVSIQMKRWTLWPLKKSNSHIDKAVWSGGQSIRIQFVEVEKRRRRSLTNHHSRLNLKGKPDLTARCKNSTSVKLRQASNRANLVPWADMCAGSFMPFRTDQG